MSEQWCAHLIYAHCDYWWSVHSGKKLKKTQSFKKFFFLEKSNESLYIGVFGGADHVGNSHCYQKFSSIANFEPKNVFFHLIKINFAGKSIKNSTFGQFLVKNNITNVISAPENLGMQSFVGFYEKNFFLKFPGFFQLFPTVGRGHFLR